MQRIQRLTIADVALMQQLNALFAEVFDDPEAYAARLPAEEYLAAQLAREHIVALVALVDEQMVGGLVAYELAKLEQSRSEFYIYDLAVKAAHRRRGIATALIRHLQEIASRRGAWVVFVQADRGDDPAIALYSKLGIREDVLHFDIEVPKPWAHGER